MSHCEMPRQQVKTAVFSSQELMYNSVNPVNIISIVILEIRQRAELKGFHSPYIRKTERTVTL